MRLQVSGRNDEARVAAGPRLGRRTGSAARRFACSDSSSTVSRSFTQGSAATSAFAPVARLHLSSGAFDDGETTAQWRMRSVGEAGSARQRPRPLGMIDGCPQTTTAGMPEPISSPKKNQYSQAFRLR
jgi:hypothetical protein